MKKRFSSYLALLFIHYFIKFAKSATSCSDGYYLNSGSCVKCNSSCLTCKNGTSCVTCSPNMFLNATTTLCQLCLSGMFYSAPLNQCLSCGTSCLDACAYQSTCFDCTSGQYYDLTARTCVSICNTTTQIAITDTQFGSKPICRDFNYYVDSSSLEIVELGTKKYPYKSLSLVTINVYLKENTVNELQTTTNYIFNTTIVNFQSYTSTNSTSPGKATFMMKDTNITMLSPQTVFNIIKNTELRVSTIISNNSGLTSNEKNMLVQIDTCIFVARSSALFNNLIFSSSLSDIQLQIYFLKPIYLQNRTFTMTNIDFVNISGRVCHSIDPYNLHLENITMDYYSLMGGFSNWIQCNYPEAFLVVPINAQMLNYQGAGNFTLTLATWGTYGTSLNDITPIEMRTAPECNPSDTEFRLLDISYLTITLEENPYSDRFTQIYFVFEVDSYTRQVTINYHDNIHVNITDSYYSIIGFFVAPLVNTIMINNTFTNCSSRDGIIKIFSTHNVTMNGIYFYNLYNLIQRISRVIDFQYLTINGMIWHNDKPLDLASVSYFTHISLPNSILSMSNVHVYGTNLHERKIMDYALGGNGSFSLTNSLFENLQLSAGNSMFQTGSINGLLIQNCTFTGITGVASSDIANTMIEINGLDLSTSLTFQIKDITITNSSSKFLQLSSINNSPITSQYLNITNFSFINATIQYANDLIYFGDIETQVDLTIIFTNIVFNSISFLRGGNMLNLQHQIKNPVVIQNSQFSNIFGGSINFESSNKVRLDLPTQVKFINLTVNSCNGNYNSFISAYTGAKLDIQNSLFTNIFNIKSGSVLYAGYQTAHVSFTNSVFKNNTSVKGGVFNTEYESLVILNNCTVTYNFAVESGVIQSSNNGYYQFYSSIFHHNFALSSAFGEIFDVSNTPVINNCTIYQNFIKTKSQVLYEINNVCVDLCFLNNVFTTYIVQNSLSISSVVYAVSLISGQLSIQNGTTIYLQDYFINAFSSIITMSNTTIYNCSFTSNLITLTSTEFTVNISSTINTNGVEISSSTASKGLIQIETCTGNNTLQNLVINSVSLTKCETTYSIFTSLGSYFSLIQNCSFSNLNCNVLEFQSSTIAKMAYTSVSNSTSGIRFQGCNVEGITNLSLSNLGSSTIIKGAGIYSLSSNITILNSLLISNKAISGAGVYIDCILGDYCYSQIANSTFTNNIALESGGAIKYNYKRPDFQNNSFTNNSASYGPNIASYSIKIIRKGSTSDNITISNIGSGIAINETFQLALTDYDNQIMVLDNTSQIKVVATSNSSKVTGIDSVKVYSGVGTFENLVLNSKPGSSSVYQANSKSIDSTKILQVFGKNQYNNYIYSSFRFCMPGEIEQNGICLDCTPGSYSFEWNSTSCKICMNNAVCLGKVEISVNSGYWRKTSNSTTIIECPNKAACTGGYVDRELFPETCADGYSSFLCSTCVLANGTKYERTGEFECSKCPNPIYNAIRVIGVLILAFIFLMLLIAINIRKTKESQTSILLRIFTNYLQLIAAAMSFNLRFPSSITSIFLPVNKISSSDTFMSFDCFITNYDIRAFAPNNAIFKVFLTGILPIILICIVALIFIVLYYISKKWFGDVKRNIGISAICIIFLLHPTLTKVSLGLFQCIQIDVNDNRMRNDLDIECYSGEHILWMVSLGFPMIFVWVFGTLAFALFILIKNRNRLEDEQIKRYFLILYQGLKEKTFYWEFVNTLRKVLILASNVVLAAYNGIYRAIFAIVVLVVIFRIQIKIHPYKNNRNNEIEILAILVGSLTLFSGTIFISDNTNQDVLNSLIMIVVIAFNVYFFLHWVLLLLISVNLKAKIFQTIVSMLCTILMQESLFKEFQEQSKLKQLESQNDKGTTSFNLKETIQNKGKSERKKIKKPAGILKQKKKKTKRVIEENKEDKEDKDQVFWVIGDRGSTHRDLNVHELKIKEEELSQIINHDVTESNDSFKQFIKQQKKRMTQMVNLNDSSLRESSSDIFIPVVIDKEMNRVSNNPEVTGDRIFDNNSSSSFKHAFGGNLKRNITRGMKRGKTKRAKK